MRAAAEASPRYLQILEALRARIAGGTYGIGSLLPTEAQLCDSFGASRFTIREALRRLVELGLVERRKGSGTIVTAAQPSAGFTHAMHSLSELHQYALDTVFDIATTRLVTIDATTAELMGADAGTRWLRVAGVRRMGGTGEPICYTAAHVDAMFAPLLADVRSLKTPIYAAVEARGGRPIAEAVQEIRGATLPAAAATALALPRGSAAILVLRRYLDRDGRILLCSLNWHAARDFRYAMRLRRGEPNPPPAEQRGEQGGGW